MEMISNTEKTNETKLLFWRIFKLCIAASFGLFFYSIADYTYGDLFKLLGSIICLISFIVGSFRVFQYFIDGGSLASLHAYRYKNTLDTHIENKSREETTDQDINNKLKIEPIYVEISNQIQCRLIEEIKSQGRKANVNLFMGLITAVISILILGWLSEQVSDNFQLIKENKEKLEVFSQVGFISIYYGGIILSKIFLSITSSVFSFFFLSTYRRNLSEIKFFQNELTNVEYRLLSIFMARDLGQKDTLNAILLKNTDIERNFLLKKGETTTDLRAREIDVGESETIITLATRIASEVISSVKYDGTKPNKKI